MYKKERIVSTNDEFHTFRMNHNTNFKNFPYIQFFVRLKYLSIGGDNKCSRNLYRVSGS